MSRSDGSQRGELAYFRQRLDTYCLSSSDREELSELLGTLSKNGFHPDEFGIAHPKQSGQAESAWTPSLPKTLLEIRNHSYWPGIDRCERVVNQSLASGYVKSEQYQTLKQRLSLLVLAYDRLRLELQQIPSDTLRQADEEVGGKT